ncbi:MAG: AlpA family phage regulatory protein [Burkholderiales bacterium]|nr:AlpA family phage regulatory protein [Burkholderiales bacterium]
MNTPNHDVPAAAPAPAPERLIRLPAVLDLVGLGRTAVLDRVKAGAFPAPVRIGRAALWREAEVSAWVVAQVRAHREGR